jgi:uncharacterized membrane protein YcaP (DUF421 family)
VTLLPESWPAWLSTLVATPIACIALLVVLRIAGKRTLAKMTAYGLTITVAFGSVFASVLLDRSVPLLEGAVAFAVLAGLQGVLAWASLRSNLVARAVTSRPTALVCRGRVDETLLRRERIRLEEVRTALRAAGHASVSEALAVVLETDGSLSVVAATGSDPAQVDPSVVDALSDVEGWWSPPSDGELDARRTSDPR